MSFPKRLLALELRTGRLGFAVFEGPTSLLDWGVRTFEIGRRTLQLSVSERIRVLFAFYSPAEIVLCARVYHLKPQKNAYAAILKATRSESKSHSIKVSVFSARQIRTCFAKRGQILKHEIALAIVRQFPELSWKLPRRRKFYQSERAVMLVFDAVANGITFFQRQSHSSFKTYLDT